jgi:LPPG:FO 2-phospho-L-lactate transferase
MKVVALAGGVGGAKLADGLAQAMPPGDLSVIVNTGDDFEHLGLHICPDLDTVCYTLAGVANPITGWGRAGETWAALETLSTLGGPSWFHLGDRDLGLHLERTRRLRRGDALSTITRDFCRQWVIASTVLPMSDDPVPTWVSTLEGELPFQEYFVHRQCLPQVTGFRFEGVEQARPAPGVLDTLQEAALIVICPSNPWVSIDPILAVPGIRSALHSAAAPVIAVSPIIAGQTVKGPAAKMYAELGIEPSARSVANHYGGLLRGFVLDNQDSHLVPDMTGHLELHLTDTLMRTPGDRLRLAGEVLELGTRILG